MKEYTLNGIHWEVAHPLALTCGATIASMNSTILSSGEAPYIGNGIEVIGAP